jgi:hypothetical protein
MASFGKRICTRKMATKNCYAACLGGCDQISREHPLTRSVFGDGSVTTVGFPKLGEKTLSIDSLVANILCKKHNSELSKLDSEIKKVGDAVLAVQKRGADATVTVNGYLIERWCLKQFAGISASGWLNFKSLPPDDVVKDLFGYAKLPDSVALYGVSVEGTTYTNLLSISGDFIFSAHGDDALGVVVAIHGAPFVLSVRLKNPDLYIRSQGQILGYDVRNAGVERHPPFLKLSAPALNARIRINFDWSARAYRTSAAAGH